MRDIVFSVIVNRRKGGSKSMSETPDLLDTMLNAKDKKTGNPED